MSIRKQIKEPLTGIVIHPETDIDQVKGRINGKTLRQILEHYHDGYTLDVETDDYFIENNETKTLTCKLYDGYGNDVTSEVTAWTVIRTTSDTASDAIWNYNHANTYTDALGVAHKAFNDEKGVLSITLDDLGSGTKATFTFTATIDDTTTSTTINVR